MTKKVFAVLDIETLTDARLAFDIAWILYDSKGNELERHNYLVKEIVESPFFELLLSRDSFIKNKSDYYFDGLDSCEFEILSLEEISYRFYEAESRYDAKIVMCAYNARFDFNALNNNLLHYTGDMLFFDEQDIEICDIMTIAMSTICDTNKYVRWCLLNSMTTEKGNVKTNAQTVYAYLTNNVDYVEEHHALADCEIEAQILFKARKRKQKLHKKFAMPICHCPEWKQVQSRI